MFTKYAKNGLENIYPLHRHMCQICSQDIFFSMIDMIHLLHPTTFAHYLLSDSLIFQKDFVKVFVEFAEKKPIMIPSSGKASVGIKIWAKELTCIKNLEITFPGLRRIESCPIPCTHTHQVVMSYSMVIIIIII